MEFFFGAVAVGINEVLNATTKLGWMVQYVNRELQFTFNYIHKELNAHL